MYEGIILYISNEIGSEYLVVYILHLLRADLGGDKWG